MKINANSYNLLQYLPHWLYQRSLSAYRFLLLVERTLVYDSSGNLLKETVETDQPVDGITDLTETTTNTYDNAGNLLRREVAAKADADGARADRPFVSVNVSSLLPP